MKIDQCESKNQGWSDILCVECKFGGVWFTNNQVEVNRLANGANDCSNSMTAKGKKSISVAYDGSISTETQIAPAWAFFEY
jgi:hypothetical protein